MAALVFCLASSDYYKSNSFSSQDIFLSPDETNPNNETTFRIPSGSPSIHEILSSYPQIPKRPDFIFIKTDALGRNFVRDLATLGCPVVASLADTHHLHRPLERLIDYAVNQNFSLVSIENDRHHLRWYSRFGINNLCWLPNLALEPFKYEPLSALERIQKICFVGSAGKFHPYRRYILGQLSEGFPAAFDCFSSNRQQASMAYNSYLISVNVSLNSDLNWRFFEVIAAGGFLITDRLPELSGINLILEEGVHYEAFSSADELRQKVSYYLQNPKETDKIAQAGYEAYWNKLSPKVLRKEMLSRIYSFPTRPIFSPPSASIDTIPLDRSILLRIYQVCQEIHRLSVRTLVVVRDDLSFLIKEELQDFPRITTLPNREFLSADHGMYDSLVIVNDTSASIQFISSNLSRIVFCPVDLLSDVAYGARKCFTLPLWNSSFVYDQSLDAYVIST